MKYKSHIQSIYSTMLQSIRWLCTLLSLI